MAAGSCVWPGRSRARTERGPAGGVEAGMSLRFLFLLFWVLPVSALPEGQAPAAPEFTQTEPEAWLNSKPLRLAELRGQVVLIEFWTFSCGNCERSIPWVKAVEEELRDQPFLVVGVHTPEFNHERSAEAVRRKIRELGVRHPVMLDNDYAYWNAMGNRYWPAFYLIDKHGHVRHAYAGELHVGTPRGKQVRGQIKALLRE